MVMAGKGVCEETNQRYGAIPVRTLCDSRLSGLILLPDLINHAAGIEKADDGAQRRAVSITSNHISGAEDNEPRG